MKATVIGTCISISLIHSLKLDAVFSEKDKYFDVLPWNFFDSKVAMGKSASFNASMERLKESLENSDYLFVDLYALCKPLAKIYDGNKSQIIVKNLVKYIQKDVAECITVEPVEVDGQWVCEKIQELCEVLKNIFDVHKILIIRPKLARKYLDENYQVCKVDEGQIMSRQEMEDKLSMYTDCFIHSLGAECKQYDMPDDIISERANLRVHYIQRDYIRMEKEILDILQIDYKQYWKCELAPMDLLMQKWISKAKTYYGFIYDLQKKHLDISQTDIRTHSLPGMLACKKNGYYSLPEMFMHYYNKLGRKVIVFGAGEKCREFLKEYQLPINFILDNNMEKSETYLQGIEIKHPSCVEDWSSYFVIITCDITEDIEKQLQTNGLKKDDDYILYKDMI